MAHRKVYTRLGRAVAAHPAPNLFAAHALFSGLQELQGMPILDFYSLGGISKWGWLGIEFCFFVVFFLFAYLALAFRRHVKR
jgi:hypothetical protein